MLYVEFSPFQTFKAATSVRDGSFKLSNYSKFCFTLSPRGHLIIFNYQVSKTSATLSLFCHFPLSLSVFSSSLLNTVFVSKAEAAGKHVSDHKPSIFIPLLILSISSIMDCLNSTHVHIYNLNSETQSHTNTKDHQQPHN